jgi:hypothetical protein
MHCASLRTGPVLRLATISLLIVLAEMLLVAWHPERPGPMPWRIGEINLS